MDAFTFTEGLKRFRKVQKCHGLSCAPELKSEVERLRSVDDWLPASLRSLMMRRRRGNSLSHEEHSSPSYDPYALPLHSHEAAGVVKKKIQSAEWKYERSVW
ncbi:hypothetical protein R1flu_026557 [Riccia fluitans]|uniref:Uncharacterized protein n=1 Tax=Riccia fluitans TaxID=41844 RepID=A0ABD1XGA0_9MARC